jgi:hypothetical protein
MAATGTQTGSFIFGAIFIGIWLYIWLIPTDLTRGSDDLNPAMWGLWGLIGIVIAAAIYGARAAPTVGIKIAIYVVLGIAVGMIIAATLFDQIVEALATAITFVGAGLIVTALPSPQQMRERAA